jgi:hypothetical protein
MATDRQIAANRMNAGRSSGPQSVGGKARSRANATRHGLASESADLEAEFSPEFQDRRATWAAEYRPVGESAHWALDRAVAASFRIERCERAMDDLTASLQDRAQLAWEQDRAVEAATIAGRLGRDPVLASRQLRTTLAGVALLIEAWLGLAAILQDERDWSESEASRALDLLGVDPDFRSARTPIDPLDDSDPIVFRKALARDEVDRLEALRDRALIPLDELDRENAMSGDLAMLSKPAKLLLRYERDAWKRYHDAIRELNEQAPAAPAVVAPPPPPAVVKPPKVQERAASSFEDERRALQAMAAPFRNAVVEGLTSIGLVDEDAWLDELERRIEAMPTPPERTRFAVGIDPNPSRIPG